MTGMVRVRVFAGAAEAIGTQDIDIAAETVAQARAVLGAMGETAPRVIAQCAVLREGQRLDDEATLNPHDVIDILPPFAGG